MPWQHFTSPAEKWAVQPSFVVGEYLFIACALVALYHAKKSGRAHVLVWAAALIAGTANDLIFMALPVVDNFWQAQATVMLTARLPLYIPCVYVCFMYYPTVSVWRLGLSPLPSSLLTGLAAILYYAPYDIVGAKFLWWTWHDTDRPIMNRLLGAPIGSTMWVITFVAAFSYLLNRVLARDRALQPRSIGLGLVSTAGLSTALMVAQLTLLQQLDSGVPGIRGLLVLVAAYALVVAWRGRRDQAIAAPRTPGPVDRLLHAAVTLYFAALVLTMAVFEPETHSSTSVHQTYGPCHVEAKDIVGSVRYEFLCAEDYDEDFSFDCVAHVPPAGATWYMVCGRPHSNYPLWLGVVAVLGGLGIGAFTYLLTVRRSAGAPGSKET